MVGTEGFVINNEVKPSRLCDGLNVGSERREGNQCWCLDWVLSIWVNGEDRGSREVQGFTLEPVTFIMIDIVFHDRRCSREVLPGDVNLVTCLHLGLSWLQLLTPLVEMVGLDLRRPKRYASPNFKVVGFLCAFHASQV